ncbi:MAG: hypothetical protein KDD69_11855 [Bdellovibrionales bacterium]|nr:hypothetical protein [Bdellovibrionales bacterium]
MSGPTQTTNTANRSTSTAPANATNSAATLPPVEQGVGSLDEKLTEHGVTSDAVREVFRTEWNNPRGVSALIATIVRHAEEDKEYQYDPKALLAALQNPQPSEEQLNLLRETIRANKAQHERRVEDLGGSVIEKLQYDLHALQRQVADSAVGRLAPAAANPSASTDTTSSSPQVQSPQTGQPSPRPATQSAPEQPTVTTQSTTVSFHRQNRDGSLRTVQRQLALQADGAVIDSSTGQASNELTAIYLHQGKAYLADGRQVNRLAWGAGQARAQDLQRYLEPVAEGSLSGIRDGYLKEMRVLGKTAVFTKGPPPAFQNRPQSAPDSSAAATPRSDQAATPSPAPTRRETSPPAQVQSPTPTQPQPAQQNPAPALPQVTSQVRQSGPVRQVALEVDRGFRVERMPANLRIAADGRLEMEVGRGSAARWVDPRNTPGRACTCLYHQNGKLYDATGQEVRSLQWGRYQIGARDLLGYVEPMEQGKVSSIKSGYLNQAIHQGRHVVFTEGPPPAQRTR